MCKHCIDDKFSRWGKYKKTSEPQKCIIEEFVKNLPPEKKSDPVMISCPCPRCTPHSL